MKKVLLLVMTLVSVQAFAQDATPKNEIRFGRTIETTGYGALTTQYSQFNGKDATFVGMYGGVMIDHRLMIGLGGFGMLNRPDGFNAVGNTDENREVQMGYGGVVIEYSFAGTKRIHLSGNVLAGGGGISNGYYATMSKNSGSQWYSTDESGFLVIQPSLNLEMNMTSWFRISAGAGYRHITGSNMNVLSDKDMSAPTANLTIKFGIF